MSPSAKYARSASLPSIKSNEVVGSSGLGVRGFGHRAILRLRGDLIRQDSWKSVNTGKHGGVGWALFIHRLARRAQRLGVTTFGPLTALRLMYIDNRKRGSAIDTENCSVLSFLRHAPKSPPNHLSRRSYSRDPHFSASKWQPRQRRVLFESCSSSD